MRVFEFFSKNAIAINGPKRGLEVFREVISGKSSYYRDTTVMNAAFCLWIAGRADDFLAAREIVEKALDSGKVEAKVNEIFGK